MDNMSQPLSYKAEVAQYTKKDAIHALLFAAYISIIGLGFWVFATVFDLRDADGHVVSGGHRSDFLLNFIIMTIGWVMMHVLFNTVFRQFRSIIPVTLYHFAWNFAMRGDLWEYRSDASLNLLLSIGIAVGLVYLMQYFKKGRASKLDTKGGANSL